MNILVFNCGSSSIKYKLLAMPGEQLLVSGQVERIGSDDGHLLHAWTDPSGLEQSLEHRGPVRDHSAALDRIFSALLGREEAPAFPVHAIGHRVVHGGTAFTRPTRLSPEVIGQIEATIPLAPLHNPINLQGIQACVAQFPGLPQVAVFDTAFHQTIPEEAYRYAIPEEWYFRHQVRRYGFHGISHAHVAAAAAAQLGRPLSELNLITLHLGNGASAAAIRHGRCIDTSMGLTPLEGLVMGTRSGDIDPAIPLFMARVAGLDPASIDHALNHDSGLQGLCGDHDLREIQRRAAAGDDRARLALEMYVYRLRKYIGAYAAILGRVDALVFTAGVGENSESIRAAACLDLDRIGLRLDPARNSRVEGEACEIQASASSIKILVIRTNEELEIARQTLACIEHRKG